MAYSILAYSYRQDRSDREEPAQTQRVLVGFQADWPDSVPRARSPAGRGPAAAASREGWSKRLRRARGGRGPGREIATPPLGVELGPPPKKKEEKSPPAGVLSG